MKRRILSTFIHKQSEKWHASYCQKVAFLVVLFSTNSVLSSFAASVGDLGVGEGLGDKAQ